MPVLICVSHQVRETGRSTSAGRGGAKGIGVKPVDLTSAYAMIREYKEGKFHAGSEITSSQLQLIEALSADLLPEEAFDLNRIEDLLPVLARADTSWNHRAMAAIDEFYAYQSTGRLREAEEARAAFIAQCPSAWYKQIVTSL